MNDVHKPRKVTIPVCITVAQLEEVEKIAASIPGVDKRSWAIRELLKEAIEARGKVVSR